MRVRHGTPKMTAASSISGAICIMLFTPLREANGRNLMEATSTSTPNVPYRNLKLADVATAR